VSVHAATKPITPMSLRARKQGVPIVGLTAYTASLAKVMDPHVDLILVGGLGGHDGLRPEHHARRHARDDDPPRRGGGENLPTCLRRRRHAVWQLSGVAGAGVSQRRGDHEPNRLLGDQARGRAGDGGHRRVPEPARRARARPHRPDTASDQCARWLQDPGQGQRRGRAHQSGTLAAWRRRVPLPWSSRA
jgi:hypothetical protein